MIKRKKLTALICVILSVIFALCFAFTGCAEYTPPKPDPDTPPVTDLPDDPDDPDDPTKQDEEFSVQLVVKNGKLWQNFNYEFYEASDGKGGAHEQGWAYWDSLKIQWTNVETNERFFAPLDKDGKAVCPGLDGDFKVTLSQLPTGFTYEPNQNYADNITKSIEIIVYKIQSEGSRLTLWRGDDHAIKYENVRRLNQTGAYRIVLESKDDRKMCAFSTGRQGTYSFSTLVDVTQNKVNPKLTVYNGSLVSKAIYHFQDKDDGGAENTYTKNVLWQYFLPADEAKGSSALIFEIYSTSSDGNSSYPIVVDILIQRDGDYTREEYANVPVPVTEDFTKKPAKPEGTFTWAARNPVTPALLLDESKVILNTEKGRSGKNVVMGEQAKLDDGYYYFYSYNADSDTYTLTDRLYAGINRNNEIMEFTDPRVSFRFIQGKNYQDFVNIYREHCSSDPNSDGCYPVNAELATFLQDFAVANRIFNDGYGLAEGINLLYTENGVLKSGSYASDEESMWLFACGYYMK